MEKNQAGKEYPQTWNNMVLQWNFDFLNHLGKSRLVRVIRRFEKSRDKITVLYLTANGSQVWFMLPLHHLESQTVKKLGFYCLSKHD